MEPLNQQHDHGQGLDKGVAHRFLQSKCFAILRKSRISAQVSRRTLLGQINQCAAKVGP